MKRYSLFILSMLLSAGAAQADSVQIQNYYYPTPPVYGPAVVYETQSVYMPPVVYEATKRPVYSIVGEGWAVMAHPKYKGEARAAAIRAALDDALAKRHGAVVRSRSTVRDHVLIESRIVVESAGEIARYEILDEYRRGKRYYVRLRAWTPRGHAAEAGLGRLRLAMMVVDRDGASRPNREVMRAMRRELGAWGLNITAEAYRSHPAAPYSGEIRDFGRRYNADHVLVVEVDDRTRGRGLHDRFVHETGLTVRVVRVGDGEVESTLAVAAAGPRDRYPAARIAAYDSAATAMARKLATALAEDHACLTGTTVYHYDDRNDDRRRWDYDDWDDDDWDD